MEPLPTPAESGNTSYVKISSQNVKISLNAARKSILDIFAMLTLMADIYELVQWDKMRIFCPQQYAF